MTNQEKINQFKQEFDDLLRKHNVEIYGTHKHRICARFPDLDKCPDGSGWSETLEIQETQHSDRGYWYAPKKATP